MNEKLLLQDLVVLLAKKSGITQKDADRFYRELVQLILDTIYENDIVKIKDFGTFKLVSISARESVDVNTGEKIQIPAHFRLTFIPDRTLKELVNKPFEQFESVVLEDGVDLTLDIGQKDIKEDNVIIDRNTEENKRISERRISLRESIAKVEDTSLDISENDLIPLESVKRMRANRYISPIEPISDSDSVRTIRDKKNDSSKDKKEVSLEIEDKPVIKSSIGADRPPISEIRISERKRERITLEPEIKKIDQQIRTSISTIEKTKGEKSNLDEGASIVQKKDHLVLDQERDGLPLETHESSKNLEVEEEVAFEGEIQYPNDDVNNQEDKELVEGESDSANTDFDYGYVDYEKINELSKKRKRIPIIILAVLAGVFAVYQFAKLFDVTHDYEYYINRPHRLTLTDTLPYLDEKSIIKAELDTSGSLIGGDVENVMAKSNISEKNVAQEKNQLPQISGITSKVDSVDNFSSNLESVLIKLDSQSINITDIYQVSENFQIKVMDKAGSFLKKNRALKED